MTLYRITNWAETYESHETRKLEVLRYVYMPNKHDGLGFGRIAAQKNSCELFACWVLLVQIASKGRKGQRGILSRDGVPLDADDMAVMTRFPAASFTRALAFFSDPKMGWLEAKEVDTAGEMLPGFTGNPPQVPANLPAVPGQPGFTPPGIEGKEGKERKEGKPTGNPTQLPFSSDSFAQAWMLFEKHRREIKHPLTPTSTKLQLDFLEGIGEVRAIAAIRHTITKGWQGIKEPDGPPAARYTPPAAKTKECLGWKVILNHSFPDCRWAAGQPDEAHEWDKLPAEAQQQVWKEYRKTNA